MNGNEEYKNSEKYDGNKSDRDKYSPPCQEAEPDDLEKLLEFFERSKNWEP